MRIPDAGSNPARPTARRGASSTPGMKPCIMATRQRVEQPQSVTNGPRYIGPELSLELNQGSPMRGRAAEAHQPHKLEVAGSNPVPVIGAG